MKLSEPYIDALYGVIDSWLDEEVPELASRLRERILQREDTLVPEILRLTSIELRSVIGQQHEVNCICGYCNLKVPLEYAKKNNWTNIQVRKKVVIDSHIGVCDDPDCRHEASVASLEPEQPPPA